MTRPGHDPLQDFEAFVAPHRSGGAILRAVDLSRRLVAITHRESSAALSESISVIGGPRNDRSRVRAGGVSVSCASAARQCSRLHCAADRPSGIR